MMHESLFLVYHVVGTPYDLANPVGVVLGIGLRYCGLVSIGPSVVSTGGTIGLITGGVGMIARLTRLSHMTLSRPAPGYRVPS
jgi:hypothetical protein